MILDVLAKVHVAKGNAEMMMRLNDIHTLESVLDGFADVAPLSVGIGVSRFDEEMSSTRRELLYIEVFGSS